MPRKGAGEIFSESAVLRRGQRSRTRSSAGRAQQIVYIAHELTPHTRRYLVRGIMDAAICQDPGHEARSAARVLLAHCSGEPMVPDQERIRIDIFIRDNMP